MRTSIDPGTAHTQTWLLPMPQKYIVFATGAIFEVKLESTTKAKSRLLYDIHAD
jgi:hypothetical protein